jgi:hypothetical protein
MQIDTRNRECGITPNDIFNSTKCPVTKEKSFWVGYEPKQARYGFFNDTTSSLDPSVRAKMNFRAAGILECPCNSRFAGDPSIYGADTLTKNDKPTYYAQTTEKNCGSEEVLSAQACFEGVKTMLDGAPETGGASPVSRIASNVTVSESDAVNYPPGCTVQITESAEKLSIAQLERSVRTDRGLPP